MAEKIKVALIGVGNCFSGLIQGIQYYKKNSSQEVIGIIHEKLKEYTIYDIDFVAAIGAGFGGKIGNFVGRKVKTKIINILGGNNVAQNLAGSAGATVEGVFVGGGEAVGANYISPAF